MLFVILKLPLSTCLHGGIIGTALKMRKRKRKKEKEKKEKNKKKGGKKGIESKIR